MPGERAGRGRGELNYSTTGVCVCVCAECDLRASLARTAYVHIDSRV